MFTNGFLQKQAIIANLRVYIEYMPLYRTCGAHLNSLAYKSLCVLHKSVLFSWIFTTRPYLFFSEKHNYYLITFAPDYVILSKKTLKNIPRSWYFHLPPSGGEGRVFQNRFSKPLSCACHVCSSLLQRVLLSRSLVSHSHSESTFKWYDVIRVDWLFLNGKNTCACLNQTRD